MALMKNPKMDIKRKYYRILQLSLILSLSLLILAFKYFPDVESLKLDSAPPQDLIISLTPITVDPTTAPLPVRHPIPIEAPTDEILEDIDIASTELDLNATVANVAMKPTVEEVEPDVVFVVVEEMPVPIGGIEDIQKRIVYPQFAIRAGIQGRVFVKAFIDENGEVFKVELQKGIGGGCDEVAMKVVKNSLFSPGKQRGKPV